MSLPVGYEINDDDKYRAKRGEYFYYAGGDYKRAGIIDGYSGYTVKDLREEGYVLIRLITEPKTPEEKLARAEKKANDFIFRNIKTGSITRELKQKFVDAFMRDDKYGA